MTEEETEHANLERLRQARLLGAVWIMVPILLLAIFLILLAVELGAIPSAEHRYRSGGTGFLQGLYELAPVAVLLLAITLPCAYFMGGNAGEKMLHRKGSAAFYGCKAVYFSTLPAILLMLPIAGVAEQGWQGFIAFVVHRPSALPLAEVTIAFFSIFPLLVFGLLYGGILRLVRRKKGAELCKLQVDDLHPDTPVSPIT